MSEHTGGVQDRCELVIVVDLLLAPTPHLLLVVVVIVVAAAVMVCVFPSLSVMGAFCRSQAFQFAFTKRRRTTETRENKAYIDVHRGLKGCPFTKGALESLER